MNHVRRSLLLIVRAHGSAWACCTGSCNTIGYIGSISIWKASNKRRGREKQSCRSALLVGVCGIVSCCLLVSFVWFIHSAVRYLCCLLGFRVSFQGNRTVFFVLVFGSVMWSISAAAAAAAAAVWRWSRIVWGIGSLLLCVDEIKGDTIFSPRVFPMLAIVI